MLTYCYGTDLYSLAAQLIEELDKESSQNVLEPEIFVVQNHGMANWLSLYIAEKKGVAANLKFEFPAERIWKLIRTIDSDIPEDLPSDRHPMTWSLMQLLKDEQTLSEFPELQYYIAGSSGDTNTMRTWKLSSKIADVFDQYLIYRPELISKWDRGELQNTTNSAERWQSKLWQLLNTHWQKNYNKTWLHRVQLQAELLNRIESGNLDTSSLPSRITVFGVSMMPPGFTEIITNISKLVDINFYQLRPSIETGGSNSFKNPLLKSLGNIFEEQENVLHSNIKSVGDVHKIKISETSSSKQSLLQSVQLDLKRDAEPDEIVPRVQSTDSSIQVHACHSPMREVEVLYDQLLAKFDEDRGLNPNDILIMTPDIETYLPVIEAVFGSPQEGQPDMPYTIVDQGKQNSESVIEIFLQFLSLCESRFKVTEVIDLLESDVIKESYGFSEEDLNYLILWVKENNIRWGIDSSFKKGMDLPKSNSFTWKSGLNRILAGYMLKAEDDELYNQIYPYHEIETSANAELAGAFYSFIEHLSELSDFANRAYTPEEWSQKLSEMISLILPDSRDHFWELSKLRDALNKLENVADLGGYSSKISFPIVRAWLEDYLQEKPVGGGGLGRGITFSSLRPMRSIPFKMIGMIGMDEGKFPQSKIPIEFSLIEAEPHPGDPDRAEEDRYLFLENILSAQSDIYFSYVGQSNQQDVEYPPSVVLKEFLDYLEECYEVDSNDLVRKHRLQGFSDAYFKGETLFTYSKTNQRINEKLLKGTKKEPRFYKEILPEPEEDWQKLSVNDLISFYQHPAKYLLNNRLGIYFGENDIISEDREPFFLTGLDDYRVGQELLNRFMEDKSLDKYKDHLRARDMLPEGWSGDQAYQNKVEEVTVFGNNLKSQFNQQQLEDIDINVTIGNFHLIGKLNHVYEEALIDYRFGNMKPKNLVKMWIRHLCFQLCKPEGHPGISRLFTLDNGKPLVEYKLGSVDEAETMLARLLDLYWTGLQKLIYLFPESSFAFGHEVCLKNEDESTGLYKASKKWIREWGSYPGEGEDPYNKLLLGSQNPLELNEFQVASKKFWSPFFEALIEEDN
ncbi:MAG: exodeoxyribonuclease V subunit gamma [Balneolaceae bacterium]|nr:exodeoxyribonuclease V subunit gamma [Balneolaceae bacterium]